MVKNASNVSKLQCSHSEFIWFYVQLQTEKESFCLHSLSFAWLEFEETTIFTMLLIPVLYYNEIVFSSMNLTSSCYTACITLRTFSIFSFCAIFVVQVVNHVSYLHHKLQALFVRRIRSPSRPWSQVDEVWYETTVSYACVCLHFMEERSASTVGSWKLYLLTIR